MISTFLTQIAQDYDPRIKTVGFTDLSDYKGSPRGIIWRRMAGQYIIEIDADRLQCVHKILFVLFHELGHVKLGHLHNRAYGALRDDFQETEADRWAFEQLGMTEICQRCINTSSKICLKGEEHAR